MSVRDTVIGWVLLNVVLTSFLWIATHLEPAPPMFLPGAVEEIGYMFLSIACAAMTFFIGGYLWSVKTPEPWLKEKS